MKVVPPKTIIKLIINRYYVEHKASNKYEVIKKLQKLDPDIRDFFWVDFMLDSRCILIKIIYENKPEEVVNLDR